MWHSRPVSGNWNPLHLPQLEGLDSSLHAAGNQRPPLGPFSRRIQQAAGIEAALKAMVKPKPANLLWVETTCELGGKLAGPASIFSVDFRGPGGVSGRVTGLRGGYPDKDAMAKAVAELRSCWRGETSLEQGYLRAALPATCLARELPQDTFPSFEADDGLFFQAAPPPAAAPTPVEVSPQYLPAAIPEASEALAPPPAEPADPASPRSAPDNLSPPPNVVLLISDFPCDPTIVPRPPLCHPLLRGELPQDTFPSFEADDELFFQAAPPPVAASTPVEVSPQDLPVAIPEASEALAPPPAEPADPASPRSAPDNLSPPPNVV
ncbi:resuscitation-promoting factor RpfA-like [Zingiber officinale]|uniref:resuscitation-promoting factor RpfA-like n=1 Tax=Zingiber officinale TaxID=94328 RepID=UPI001C4CFB23|nr:resuscitation-promoting factor RpfA-like [Zingiber officinale]